MLVHKIVIVLSLKQEIDKRNDTSQMLGSPILHYMHMHFLAELHVNYWVSNQIIFLVFVDFQGLHY